MATPSAAIVGCLDVSPIAETTTPIERPEAIDEFLAELAALIEPVEVHFRWRPQTWDLNDEMVLEAATNGRADALVTHNVADFAQAGERFKIPVMRPSDLLKKVKP